MSIVIQRGFAMMTLRRFEYSNPERNYNHGLDSHFEYSNPERDYSEACD